MSFQHSKAGAEMSLVRYEKNPFTKDMIIPVKGRKVQLSPLGRDNNILVDQHTGESYGTHVTTYKKVDEEQFVKLFTRNIGMTFEFTTAGIKAFSILLWCVQNKSLSKDEVFLDSFALKDFLKEHSGLQISWATLKRGINEMERAKIVAKTLRRGRYFINPNFVFNGDRVAFTMLLERDTKSPVRSPGQSDAFPSLLEKALEDTARLPSMN